MALNINGRIKILWNLCELSYQKHMTDRWSLQPTWHAVLLRAEFWVFRNEPAIKPAAISYCFLSRQRSLITEILKSECVTIPKFYLSISLKEWSNIFMVGRWSFFSETLTSTYWETKWMGVTFLPDLSAWSLPL